jgi:ABC-type transport system involved in multi-copper enzyme maturation permease subunit
MLIVLFCLTAILLLLSPRNNIIPTLLMLGLNWIVMIRIAVFSAGSIAGEKEARTWPILLVTTLGDKEIIRGKAVAAIRRNIPLLLLYLVLICISYANLGLQAFPQILISLLITTVDTACSMLFLAGIGVYFGVRLKTTTTAVVATVGSYLIMAYLFRVGFSVSFSLLFSAIRASWFIWVFHASSIIYSLAMGGIGIHQMRCAVRRVRRDIF